MATSRGDPRHASLQTCSEYALPEFGKAVVVVRRLVAFARARDSSPIVEGRRSATRLRGCAPELASLDASRRALLNRLGLRSKSRPRTLVVALEHAVGVRDRKAGLVHELRDPRHLG